MKHSGITGVILAGGQAKRMGGLDKGLLKLQGRYLIEHVLTVVYPQVEHLIISANRHIELYEKIGQCEVISDTIQNYAGPLAGMAASLQVVQTPYTFFTSCDVPLLDTKIVTRLFETLTTTQTKIVFAHDGKRPQYLCSLLKTELLEDLLAFLQTDQRKVGQWYINNNALSVDCSDIAQSFLNLNTTEDYHYLESNVASTLPRLY